MYDLCHVVGDELRGGKGHARGGREDIGVALAIAAKFELEIDFFTENARKFKNSLSLKLQKAWQEDDVDTLVGVFCGVERNAATALVDHRESELVEDVEEFYEIDLNEAEEEPAIEMIEVLIMSRSTVQRRKYGGNAHKPRKKPALRCTKQLQFEMEV